MTLEERRRKQLLIDEKKAEAEKLWRKLSSARDKSEKARLRKAYEKLVTEYALQKEILQDKKRSPAELLKEIPKRARFTLAPSERPNPYHCTDYREFITQWLKKLKSGQGLTLKHFAAEVAISPLELVRVLKDWKPMPKPDLERVLALLDINETEKCFLRALHDLSDSGSFQQRRIALNQLSRFAAFKARHPAEFEIWRYLSEWYYVAIREMASTEGFTADPAWIQKRLRKKVGLGEIRKALDFLQKAGFIQIEPDGKVKSLQKEIECQGGLYRTVLGEFHRQMLEYCSTAISEVPSGERALLGKTLPIPASHYESARWILEEALKKIGELSIGCKSTDQIYHVEVCLVPMTKTDSTS